MTVYETPGCKPYVQNELGFNSSKQKLHIGSGPNQEITRLLDVAEKDSFEKENTRCDTRLFFGVLAAWASRFSMVSLTSYNAISFIE